MRFGLRPGACAVYHSVTASLCQGCVRAPREGSMPEPRESADAGIRLRTGAQALDGPEAEQHGRAGRRRRGSCAMLAPELARDRCAPPAVRAQLDTYRALRRRRPCASRSCCSTRPPPPISACSAAGGAEQPGPGRPQRRGLLGADWTAARRAGDRPRRPWRWVRWRRCTATGRARATGCAAGSPCAARRRWPASRPSGRSRAAAAAAGPATAAAGLALFCRHLFDDQRRLAGRPRRGAIGSPPIAPTAGAGSPRRSPSSAAAPP